MKTLFLMLTLAALPATAAPLSFSEAVEHSVDRSTLVKSQMEKVEAVWARNYPSRLAMLPKLSLEMSKSQTQPFGLSGSRTSGNISATLSLNIFRFGADVAAMSAAELEVFREQNILAKTVLNSEALAVDALVAHVRATMQEKVRSHLVEIHQAAYDIAQARFRQGLLAAQEAEKLRIDLENARAELADAQVGAKEASAALVEQLGHTEVVTEWPWKALDKDADARIGELEKNLGERPDWKAAEADVNAHRERASELWGKMLPSLDVQLSGNYGNQQNPAPYQTGWEGKLVLSVPIFERLIDYGAYKEKKHEAMQAEQGLEGVKRLARKEWDSTVAGFRISLASARIRDTTVQSARKLYEDNVKRFHRGLVAANELVVDQNRLASAELFAIQGWASAHLGLSRVCHAAGLRLRQCK